jgi:hypothetical protein
MAVAMQLIRSSKGSDTDIAGKNCFENLFENNRNGEHPVWGNAADDSKQGENLKTIGFVFAMDGSIAVGSAERSLGQIYVDQKLENAQNTWLFI